MIALIKEIELLNRDYQAQNNKLLNILGTVLQRSTSPIPYVDLESGQQKQSTTQQNKFKKSAKQSSALNNSCFSRQTIRKCESCKSIKNSRMTEKSLKKKKHFVQKVKHETNMMKIEKLSSKVIPKVSKNWLYSKKSKIFHFED